LLLRKVALAVEAGKTTRHLRPSTIGELSIGEPKPPRSKYTEASTPNEVDLLLQKIAIVRRGFFTSQAELTDAVYLLLADIEADANVTLAPFIYSNNTAQPIA
jgi:hypothetical protein